MAHRTHRPGSLLKRIAKPGNLIRAYTRVAGGTPAPGVDGVTPQRFGLQLDEHVRDLSSQLRNHTYRSGPLRAHTRKMNGKERVFGMATVRDRVAQRCALDVLAATLDSRQSSASFAYRKGHHWLDALNQVEKLRDHGRRWVYRFDIRDFFESIDHLVLSDQLATSVPDEQTVDLLMSWASTPTVTRRGEQARRQGLPLGIPISAALANHHLAAFDHVVERDGRRLVRYAEDGVVMCHSAEEAHASERLVGEALRHLGLEVQKAKSHVGDFDGGFVFLGWRFVGAGGLPVEERDGWTHPLTYRRERHFGAAKTATADARQGSKANADRLPKFRAGVSPR